MRKEDSGRRFSRELKLAAVQRMAMGANVSKLSLELGVSRKGLYQWQKQFRVGGSSALRGAGRPQRAWRDGIYKVIQAMMASGLQGVIGIERMCRLAGVSRAGYYRHWQASSPRREEAGLRDAIQRLALSNPHYGYRRIAVLLGRESWRANHKRVLRLMREDNLLCLRKAGFVPMTTDSRHGWRIVPNLARGLQLTDIDQLWVADITYVHLAEEFAYLAIVLDAYSRKVIGWAMATHLKSELAIAALDQRLRCADLRRAASSTTAIAACNMPALNTLHDLRRIASSRA